MQSQPKAFESLDWYRDASRREYRSNSAWRKLMRWLKSARCFAFHIGVFALGITTLLAINIATSPDDIWIERILLVWLIVIIVHAGIAGVLYAISLLGTSEQPIPNFAPPANQPVSSWEAQSRWPAPPEPQSVETPETKPEGWSTDAEQPSASWRELTPSSWLRRKRPDDGE